MIKTKDLTETAFIVAITVLIMPLMVFLPLIFFYLSITKPFKLVVAAAFTINFLYAFLYANIIFILFQLLALILLILMFKAFLKNNNTNSKSTVVVLFISSFIFEIIVGMKSLLFLGHGTIQAVLTIISSKVFFGAIQGFNNAQTYISIKKITTKNNYKILELKI